MTERLTQIKWKTILSSAGVCRYPISGATPCIHTHRWRLYAWRPPTIIFVGKPQQKEKLDCLYHNIISWKFPAGKLWSLDNRITPLQQLLYKFMQVTRHCSLQPLSVSFKRNNTGKKNLTMTISLQYFFSIVYFLLSYYLKYKLYYCCVWLPHLH